MIKDGGIMLTQKEWLDILIAKTGCSKKEAKTVLSCSFEYIKELLNEDNPIRIQNFGVFKIKKVAAREIMNLQTKKMEIIPEHNAVIFKPSFNIDYKPDIVEIEDEELEFFEEKEEFEGEELAASNEYYEEFSEEIVLEEFLKNDEEDIIIESEEIDILDVALTWIFEGKELNCYELIACLEAKTTLKEKEIRKSLEIIIDIMLKAGKSVCEVKEIDGELDFVILK